ncbi:MAG TPA: ArsA family ATPase [Myxococcaceae bacterium]|nr:ArsA family ATPase [Myxococcaceae bacterium]
MMDSRILHFFGGKGGVGKTTLATAFSLNLAEKAPEEKVLLISLDTSKALSDLLKKKVPEKPFRVGNGNHHGLFVAELDRTTTLEPFRAKNKAAFDQAIVKGALLTEEDTRQLLNEATADLEDVAGLFQILDWLEEKAFDRIVVDTAPTTQALRLLDSPQALKKLLTTCRGGEKFLKARKAGSPAGPLDGLNERVEKLQALLKDPARTAFHLVALAEPVVEAQTRYYFSQLRSRAIPVSEITVNQVEDGIGCPACQGRRGLQAPHVRKFQQLDKTVPVQLVARREIAPRGAEALSVLASEWLSGKESKALEFAISEGPPALVRAPSMPPIAAPPLPPTRLIFFVGQGGVGKSSCAAAAAVTLTEKEGPVLLISTDRAHSLSDVLQSRLTDTETQVKGTKGLYARELDASGWFNSLRKRLKELSESLFEPDAKAEFALDREMLKNLLDFAPAGVDELSALGTLTDALVQERFKRIVVDPSPASGTVRLVELPEAARGWLTSVLGILVRHRSKGTAPLVDEISALLKHVKRFEDALTSPNEARFVVVTRGEELATPRTERLVEFLKARKLAVERVLVNRVLPKSACPKCENRRKLELAAAKNIEKKLGLPVTVAPALGRHPAGLRELKAFRTSWYALSAPAKIKAA